MDNHEIEEVQLNNALDVNRLGNPQYKLIQRRGEFSRGRSQEITEQETPGMRWEISEWGELITAMGIPQGKLK